MVAGCLLDTSYKQINSFQFQLDDAGVYAAVSCSDKTIAIFDFETGDCEAAVYGHSGLFSIFYVEQPPEVFCKEGVIKYFATQSGKHLR